MNYLVTALHAVFDAVLFDLDGTLADTAPDLCGAMGILLAEGRSTAAGLFQPASAYLTQGVRTARQGFSPSTLPTGTTSASPHAFSKSTLADCANCRRSSTESGAARCAGRHSAWGIVTNKLGALYRPAGRFRAGSACARNAWSAATPPPPPSHRRCRSWHACAVGCSPRRTLYVGDDRRDIVAGQAAGTLTAAIVLRISGDGGRWNLGRRFHRRSPGRSGRFPGQRSRAEMSRLRGVSRRSAETAKLQLRSRRSRAGRQGRAPGQTFESGRRKAWRTMDSRMTSRWRCQPRRSSSSMSLAAGTATFSRCAISLHEIAEAAA